jgi:hypothetical protein
MLIAIPFVLFALAVLGAVVITQWSAVSTYAAMLLGIGALALVAFGLMWAIAAFSHWQRRKELDLAFAAKEKQLELYLKRTRIAPDRLGNYAAIDRGHGIEEIEPANPAFQPTYYVNNGQVSQIKPPRKGYKLSANGQPVGSDAHQLPDSAIRQIPADEPLAPAEPAMLEEGEEVEEDHLLEQPDQARTLRTNETNAANVAANANVSSNSRTNANERMRSLEEIGEFLATAKRRGEDKQASIQAAINRKPGGGKTWKTWEAFWDNEI